MIHLLIDGVIIGIFTICIWFYYRKKYLKLASTAISPIQKKNARYFDLLNGWLRVKNSGKSSEMYFSQKGYKDIAVYGVGEIGKRLFEELRTTPIAIQYFIDTKPKYIDDTPCFTVKEINEKMHIDAIIVTPIFAYDSIKESLLENIDFEVEIINMTDVIIDLI